MQIAQCFYSPVTPEFYAYPKVIYSDTEISGIYFETNDEQFARVTFENLDAIKIVRGEYLPYKDDYDWKENMPSCWIFKVSGSEWLKQRFEYEKEYYDGTYEWGGDVNEMATDFTHYVFHFHDQIIETIAKGFWIEKSAVSLSGKPLQSVHPFLNISNSIEEEIIVGNLSFEMKVNPLPQNELISLTDFCSQTIASFELKGEQKTQPDYKYQIHQRNNGELMSCLTNYFGTKIFTGKGIMPLNEIKDIFIKLKLSSSNL